MELKFPLVAIQQRPKRQEHVMVSLPTSTMLGKSIQKRPFEVHLLEDSSLQMPNLTELTTNSSRPQATWVTSFPLSLKMTIQLGRTSPSQWTSSQLTLQLMGGESTFFRPMLTVIPVSSRTWATKKMPLSITLSVLVSRPFNQPKPQLVGMDPTRVGGFHFP